MPKSETLNLEQSRGIQSRIRDGTDDHENGRAVSSDVSVSIGF